MRFNPNLPENRYSIDFLVYLLMREQPKSVHLITDQIDVAMAVVRRIPYGAVTVFADTEPIQKSLNDDLCFPTTLHDKQHPAEVALFPFFTDNLSQINGERKIIACCYNALSYKSLAYPGSIKRTIFRSMAQFLPDYQVTPEAGLFSPYFIFLLGLAKLFEKVRSSLYFQLEASAMAHIFTTGFLWRLSYLVIFSGRRAE